MPASGDAACLLRSWACSTGTDRPCGYALGTPPLEVTVVQVVRRFGGALLWILASLLGVVAGLLCITVVLLPVGIPLLLLTRRLFGVAWRLWMPRGLSHPVEELGKTVRKQGREARKNTPAVGDTAKSAPKSLRRGLRRRTRRARRRLAS